MSFYNVPLSDHNEFYNVPLSVYKVSESVHDVSLGVY